MPRTRLNARRVLIGYNTAGPVGDLGLLVLRVFAGLALALAHGINKVPPSEGFIGMIGGFGFPAPALLAWLSAVAEFGGGLLLALGLATRPAAFMIVINMAVAVLFAHADDPFSGMELPLLFLFVAAMYTFTGAGRYSIDRLLNRPRI
jgi:putative oxidoreductase